MLTLQKIPFKNMKAHPVRTMILIVIIFVQAACAFGGMMIVQGMREELAAAEARLGADLLVYPAAAASRISMKTLLMQGTPVKVYKDRSMLSRMDSCEDIRQVSYQIYISDTLPDGSDIWITGFDPETDFVISPWTEKGEPLPLMEGSVVAGSKVDIAENHTVTLFGKEWPVGAHLMETGSPLDGGVFVSMDTLKKMIQASEEAGIETFSSVDPETDFSAALVRVSDKNKVQSVTDWINIYVRKVTAVRSEETLTRASSGIQGTAGAMAVLTAVIWFILLIALAIIQSVLMKERRKEIYVWRSIGASHKIINRMMLSEALFVHLAGAAAGVVIAGVFFFLYGSRLLPGFQPAISDGIAAGVIAVLAAAAFGLISARISVRRVTKKLEGQMLMTV